MFCLTSLCMIIGRIRLHPVQYHCWSFQKAAFTSLVENLNFLPILGCCHNSNGNNLGPFYIAKWNSSVPGWSSTLFSSAGDLQLRLLINKTEAIEVFFLSERCLVSTASNLWPCGYHACWQIVRSLDQFRKNIPLNCQEVVQWNRQLRTSYCSDYHGICWLWQIHGCGHFVYCHSSARSLLVWIYGNTL